MPDARWSSPPEKIRNVAEIVRRQHRLRRDRIRFGLRRDGKVFSLTLEGGGKVIPLPYALAWDADRARFAGFIAELNRHTFGK